MATNQMQSELIDAIDRADAAGIRVLLDQKRATSET